MSRMNNPIIFGPNQEKVFQPSLPFPSEPLLYLNPGSIGYFTHMVHYEKMRSNSYPMRLLPEVLRCADKTRDNYLTVQQYFKKNRRLVNLWQINAAFADLDTYQIPSLRNLTPEGLALKVIEECQDKKIPIPSIILFSGRGLQIKWILDRPLPRAALPRWNAVQRYITGSLRGLGADFNSIDGSRVLRLEQTVNTKSGEVVRVLWPEGNASPILWDFETLAREVLPFTREELQEARAKREAGKIDRRLGRQTQFNRQTLAWARVEDIRKLAHLRGWTEGNPDGYRDPFVFLSAVQTSYLSQGNPLFWETEALGKEFAPMWNQKKLLSKVSSVFRMVEQGRRYKYTNQKIMDILEIVPNEERHLQTIISKDEARRRDRERHKTRRRAAGMLTRDEYEARRVLEVAEMQRKAIDLRQKGLSYRQIGLELGISEAGAWKLLNRR